MLLLSARFSETFVIQEKSGANQEARETRALSAAMLGDTASCVKAPPPEAFSAVFDSPELLDLVAGHARRNHLADVSALHRMTKTTRRTLAHVLPAERLKLRLTRTSADTRIVSSNIAIVDTHCRHVSLRGLAETHRDFWPSLHVIFDEFPDVKIVYLSVRCTWKGPDLVRFLDWFTRRYPNRVLACNLGCLSPRDWYKSHWALAEALPAVKFGVVQLVEDVPYRNLHTRMMGYVAKAEKAVAALSAPRVAMPLPRPPVGELGGVF